MTWKPMGFIRLSVMFPTIHPKLIKLSDKPGEFLYNFPVSASSNGTALCAWFSRNRALLMLTVRAAVCADLGMGTLEVHSCQSSESKTPVRMRSSSLGSPRFRQLHRARQPPSRPHNVAGPPQGVQLVLAAFTVRSPPHRIIRIAKHNKPVSA